METPIGPGAGDAPRLAPIVGPPGDRHVAPVVAGLPAAVDPSRRAVVRDAVVGAGAAGAVLGQVGQASPPFRRAPTPVGARGAGHPAPAVARPGRPRPAVGDTPDAARPFATDVPVPAPVARQATSAVGGVVHRLADGDPLALAGPAAHTATVTVRPDRVEAVRAVAAKVAPVVVPGAGPTRVRPVT